MVATAFPKQHTHLVGGKRVVCGGQRFPNQHTHLVEGKGVICGGQRGAQHRPRAVHIQLILLAEGEHLQGIEWQASNQHTTSRLQRCPQRQPDSQPPHPQRAQAQQQHCAKRRSVLPNQCWADGLRLEALLAAVESFKLECYGEAQP